MAAPSPEDLRREFLLDPEIAFLNHGSFGACPWPVFERYQAWQRELETEPVDFLDRRLPDLLDAARAALAEYVGCSAQDLAFVQNATTGVNLAARSLDLRAGDEVLSTDLEYGACDLAWDWVCRRADARHVRAPIPLPLSDPAEVADALFARAGERTRAVFVSHVTPATGLVLPVEELRCRSTSPSSASTTTRATRTSGSAHLKAQASSTPGPNTRSASTPPSSAGATGEETASPGGSRSRARAIRRRG